eukprot:PhM_4_TR12521/c0_g1_i1/m.105979
MVWTHPGIEMHAPYRDPEWAGKDKPVVDMMSPMSQFKKADWYHKGVLYGFIVQNSLNHFMQVPEQIPYTDSYSTYDCCYFSFCAMNIMQICIRGGLAAGGSHNVKNPRTRWAHNMLWTAAMIRTNLAWLFVAGYFISYELLYTYVPGFKINDPSPEGWKDVVSEGQTTFRARWASSLFLTLAHGVYTRSFRRSGMWMWFLQFQLTTYEIGRTWAWSSPTFLGYQLTAEREKHARIGSLVPSSKHEVDPDTGKTYQAAQCKYQRYGTKGEWQDILWAHQSHDYAPMNPRGALIPNPYYNPRKKNDGRVYLDRDNTVQYNARPSYV